MEEILNTEPIVSTKYVVLTTSAYLKLNEAISKAKGYDLLDSTARYSNIIPNLCKVNITYVDEVETFDTLSVMEITAELQINYPDLLMGLTLVDSFIAADTSTELTAINLTAETVDYTLNHIEAVGTTLEIIHLESSPRTVESDQAVESLVASGVTIITVEP